MKIADSLLELIGHSPMVKLNRVAEGSAAQVVAKLEFFNPCASVKDRIGLSMIEDAEKQGKIKPGDVIIGINNNYSNNIQTYKNLLQTTGTRLRVLVLREGEPFRIVP